MEKQFLEACLKQGMSLEAIGQEVGKHPSTIGYWLKKHGLTARGNSRHAPKGEINPGWLANLVARRASMREIAGELDAGYSTIRYWLGKLGLETHSMVRRRETNAAREAGHRRTYLRCPTHGHTAFFKRSEGGYRCARCNSAGVSKHRRAVKRQLVTEAGGRCTVCGFRDHPAALQFHHLDPATKEFHLGHQGQTRSIARMREEAKKCVLLCANCHAMVEAGVKKIPMPDR